MIGTDEHKRQQSAADLRKMSAQWSTPFSRVLPNVKPRMLPPDRKPQCETVALVDLKPSQCHFPFGDPADDDFGFCGAPVVDVYPHCYCAEHRAIAYIPTARVANYSDPSTPRRVKNEEAEPDEAKDLCDIFGGA